MVADRRYVRVRRDGGVWRKPHHVADGRAQAMRRAAWGNAPMASDSGSGLVE